MFAVLISIDPAVKFATVCLSLNENIVDVRSVLFDIILTLYILALFVLMSSYHLNEYRYISLMTPFIRLDISIEL